MKKIVICPKRVIFSLLIICSVCVYGAPDGEGAKGLTGAYVSDANVMVPAGSYFAISSVYNGHRYYLGVDTVAAKSGTYKVATYSAPCHATMWWVGGLFSPTGAVLPDKDYLRTYKSVYLLDKYAQAAYLALGEAYTSYHTLTLATDTANATFWHSDKTRAAKNRYVEGYIYYYSDATGIDVYRYLAYDALYGFDRAYSQPRPTATMWATVWRRVEGDNLSCHFGQASYVFEWATVAQNRDVIFTIRLEEGGVRFTSLYDGAEFYAVTPTITEDQDVLNSRVSISGEWASTHGTAEELNSYFHSNMGDVLMMTANPTPTYNLSEHQFHGTISSAGPSPVNLLNDADEWVDHQDYLHLHLNYSAAGKSISSYDSVLVTRRIFKRETEKEVTFRHTPFDYMFPFAITTQQQDFTVSAKYEATTKIINKFGTVVSSVPGETIDSLPIATLPCIKDTVWTDEEHTAYTAVHLLDTLIVNAYLADGVTPADWIQSVSLPALNQIRVVAKPYATGTIEYRKALLKYIYTYRHSSAAGDTVRVEQNIWLMQAPEDQSDAPTQFYHQTGKSGLPMIGERSRQQVAEIPYTYYVIPEIANPLPIHHDHWGYYRWFIYKQGSNVGKGIVNNWDWTTTPTNAQNPSQPFSQINSINTTWSRGLFEMRSNLNPNVATDIPAVRLNTSKLSAVYPGATAINFDDTLAVDISGYTDTLCTGTYPPITNLTSLTEPTLSYRQLFAMRPAKECAERMANCRTNSANYMQKDSVFAPIGRAFQLQPISPYKMGKSADEGNLQYVYYYNPNQTDTIDDYMGLKHGASNVDTLNINKGYAYNRVGLSKQTGQRKWHARLMSASEVLDLAPGTTKTVLLVNPRKNGGYILGSDGNGNKNPKQDILNNRTSAEDLRQHIEDEILNVPGFDVNYNYYPLTLTKTGANTITLKNNSYDSELCAHVSITILWWTLGKGVDWYNTTWLGNASTQISLSTYTSTSDDKIGNIDPALLKMYLSVSRDETYEGYLTAYTMERYNAGTLFNPDYRYRYDEAEPHLATLGATDKGGSGTINQGWCLYEIYEADDSYNHQEWAKWQRKVGNGTWKDNGDGWTGTELIGGSLETSYNGTNNEVVEYRLITQHFQLAHFKVRMRDVNTQGPSTTAILTEQEIEENYEVLASFQLEEMIGAPGTSDMVSPFHHLQFNHTQFAYHYPVGTAEHEIPAAQRVTGSDILPANGEYCIINKFEKAGYQTVEAGGGAEHGWMFCYNRASKPLVFIDFEYPRPACTDQDLVLVSNFCQPNTTSQENPHVKAEYFGHVPGTPDTAWVKIFTYLTGNFIQAGAWYQLVLPLRWSQISGFDKYRCVGTLNAAEGNDAYVLFDRFRLLGKKHALTSFQKRTTCVDSNDSIYIITRVDYNSDELAPGRIICFQFQKWDNTQKKYVPMIASDYDGSAWHRRPANTTEVYPGYYKVGMTAEESVETPAFKSLVLGADYGTIVVPEKNYDPTKSNETFSPVRKAAIDRIAQILGGDRSAYYDETDRIKTYSDIMTATTFDFGPYNNPKGKFYVNEGTNENPHWVMYIIVRVEAADSDDRSFRIAMNTVETVDQRPNFSDAACSNERIVRVHGSVDMLIDGEAGWPNKDRETLRTEGNLLPANSSVALTLHYNAPADAKPGTTTSCHFDLVRAFAFMDGYTEMTPEQQAAADAEWERIYGCTVGDFQEAMNVFRAEDVHNPNRDVTDWNDVTKESFRWIHGYNAAKADSMYNLLNRLIVHDRLFEIGLSERDIYLTNMQDAYFYLRPVAASGRYTKLTDDGLRDTIVEGVICNAPIWLELHAGDSPDSLRFGYDKKFGDTYVIPVIRATKTAANTALSVRVAAISDQAVIAWDSTYVVDSNDPEWHARMATLDNKPTFRYTQDRMVQDTLFSNYYKTDQVVIFRPVDAAHIALLQKTDCECLNYDASGTVYDAEHPRAKDAAGDNVFIRPADNPVGGCNQWHVLPYRDAGDDKNNIPGYQIANNFELKAGYWYKFKTAFFNAGTIIPYTRGDNPSGSNCAYFIVAVVPDTVRWTPSHPDRTNYWNDDNNWTAVVNEKDFTGSLATVPLEESRVIIEPLESQDLLPVVNYDSLGLKEWGFKTATCKDILFKEHSQMLGQEKLTYTGKAFVDVMIKTANWQTFSPALKYVYSGDIYVPKNAGDTVGGKIQDPDFAPAMFEDGSAWSPTHNRTYPYAFYQAYYNTTVKYAFQNTDKDGELDTEDKSPKNSAEWVKTNAINQPLEPGKAVALLGFGPTDVEDSLLIVRLPKQEMAYHYIGKKPNYTEGEAVGLNRGGFADFDDITGNLAYDKATLGESDGIVYSLTNKIASKVFFFGNPTMALIDLYRLCEDNIDQLEYNGDATHTYKFTAYSMKDGSTYTTEIVDAPGKYFIAPQRCVGLIAYTERETLNIKLKPSAMVALSASGELVHNVSPSKRSMPRRANAAKGSEKFLYVCASNETSQGLFKSYLTLGESDEASRGFRKGEDAMTLASGLDYYDQSAFATPLCMYTIADNQPLMLDLRDSLKSVPVVFATLEDKVNSKGNQIYYYSEITMLSFATSGNWDKPLYLYDALSGDSIMIVNGLQVGIETPESDQIRYFINGLPKQDNGGQGGITTETEVIVADSPNAEENGVTYVYDMLGRRVATLGEYDLLGALQLPVGVYVVQRGNTVERLIIR